MSWINELVTFAQSQLGNRECEALRSRGVSDEQIRLFRIGCLNKVVPSVGQPADFVEWSWKGRRFDDMFVFPLTNALGEVQGVQLRHVDRGRKGYLDYFASSDEPVLFGLGQAIEHMWKTRQVVLVEGVYDFAPIQRVFPDAVATMKAGASEGFLRLLRRFVTDIWLAYDMDKTGRDVSFKFVREHGQEFTVHDIRFPRPKKSNGELAKDPGDLWEVWGDDQLGVFLRGTRT